MVKSILNLKTPVSIVLAACTFGVQAEKINYEGVSLGSKSIVFAANGQLFETTLQGGEAKQISKGPSYKFHPSISPDGKKLAYTQRDGANADIHILDLTTKRSRRLTYHPAFDTVVRWKEDSSAVYFRSTRENGRSYKMYQVSVDNPWPQAMNMPFAVDYVPTQDAGEAYYVPMGQFPGLSDWRYYRGGMRAGIHSINTNDNKSSLIIGEKDNAYFPTPYKQQLFYVSDKSGTANLYRFGGSDSQQLTHYLGHGIRYLSHKAGTLLFDQDGELQLYSLNEGTTTTLDVSLPKPNKQQHVRRMDVKRWLSDFVLSPAGELAYLNARGDIFTYDFATKTSRNITQTPGVNEHEMAMSADGQTLAYITDASGSYELEIRRLNGGQTKRYPIEETPSFYFDLSWSPDGRFVSFSDQRLRFWLFDIEKGQAKVIDRSEDSGQNDWYSDWSPNGRYLAYSKRMTNRLPKIFIYDTQTGKSHAVVSQDIYSAEPQFDRNGDYLYFMSSPNRASSDFKWAVLSGIDQQAHIRGNLNVVRLNTMAPAPVIAVTQQPNLDVNWSSESPMTPIDFEGIERRVTPLALDSKGVESVTALTSGQVLLTEMVWPSNPQMTDRSGYSLKLLNLNNPGKINDLVHRIESFTVSGNGQVLLYKKNNDLIKVNLEQAKPEVTYYSVPVLQARVDTEREWQQIYHESWRYVKEQFYDPNYHGNDVEKLENHYAQYLGAITNRSALSEFLKRVFGHLSVSHLYVGGGDSRSTQQGADPIGMLGGDFEQSDDGYRLKHKLTYSAFDAREGIYAPLDQPGNEVAEGEYITKVNGRTVSSDKNFYSYFRGLVDRTIELEVSDQASGGKVRKVKVVPTRSETALRLAHWSNLNAQHVHNKTDGKVAYVHIAGWSRHSIERFVRAYYGAMGKQGLIIDQRFNGGGITPDYFINMLLRKPYYAYKFRNGIDLKTPVNTFEGQKVLIANEWNGSAAETFAAMFRNAKVGISVGKATYGAGIGPYGFSMTTIDGGRIQVPNRGAFMPNGEWGIENSGVPVDHSVQISPMDLVNGIDPQLDKAIESALKPAQSVKFVTPEFPVHPDSDKVLSSDN